MFGREGTQKLSENIERNIPNSQKERLDLPEIEDFADDTEGFFELPEFEDFADETELLGNLPDIEDFAGEADGIAVLPEIEKFADEARGLGNLPKIEDFLDDANGFADLEEQAKFIDGVESFSQNDSGRNFEDDEVKYFSTYEERLRQTPKEDGERGEWEGQRGESKYIPNDEEIAQILEEYGLDGIMYEDAIPDFSDVSECTVEIDNMTENRSENFSQCDKKCAEQWNKEARDGRTDWTARDVAKWRRENGYSWHERNDMKTCDLVPTKINDYFGHLGGVSECKKRDADNGGDFDD